MDIVERLHLDRPCISDVDCCGDICIEAADEIERLREALQCVVAYWNEWRDAPDNHATALSLEEVVNIVCAALKEKE